MINQNFLSAWQQKFPWQSFDMIEQDLILSRALVELYNIPLVSESIAFKGGTALNKLFLYPPARYSEDLDFAYHQYEPIGPLIDAIRARLDPWLGNPRRLFSEHSVKLKYSFNTFSGKTAKLKLEINVIEHTKVKPLQMLPFKVDSEWFSGETKIVTGHSAPGT